MAKAAKAPKVWHWTLTTQQWELFTTALAQQQAAQQRLHDVMQSIAAAFGRDLGPCRVTAADAKTRTLTLRAETDER